MFNIFVPPYKQANQANQASQPSNNEENDIIWSTNRNLLLFYLVYLMKNLISIATYGKSFLES